MYECCEDLIYENANGVMIADVSKTLGNLLAGAYEDLPTTNAMRRASKAARDGEIEGPGERKLRKEKIAKKKAKRKGQKAERLANLARGQHGQLQAQALATHDTQNYKKMASLLQNVDLDRSNGRRRRPDKKLRNGGLSRHKTDGLLPSERTDLSTMSSLPARISDSSSEALTKLSELSLNELPG